MAVHLGLDLGEKRAGVALSDEGEILATPLKTIEFQGRKSLLTQFRSTVDEFHATKVVVGLPKTLKGETGPAAQKVMALVDWFKTQWTDIEWIYWDERLTTAEAERILLEADVSRSHRKEVRDKLAAQRILQTYLDFRRMGSK